MSPPTTTPADAFLLGYLPAIVRAHLDSLTTLVIAQSGASPALAATADQLAADLPRRGPAIVSCVMQVEDIVGTKLSAQPPSPPRTPEEGRTWASAVAEHAARAWGNDGDPSLTTARAVGACLGDAEAQLLGAARAMRLLAAQQEHPGLLERHRVLHEALVETTARFPRVLEGAAGKSPFGFSPTVQAAFAQAQQALEDPAWRRSAPDATTRGALDDAIIQVRRAARVVEAAADGDPQTSIRDWNAKRLDGAGLARRLAAHRAWMVPYDKATSQPRVFAFDKRVVLAFSDQPRFAHRPPFARDRVKDWVSMPGHALFRTLHDGVDLLVLDPGEDPHSTQVVNYPRPLHAMLRQTGEEIAIEAAACDWSRIARGELRAAMCWILVKGSTVSNLLAHDGYGRPHAAVFTRQAVLEAFLARGASREQASLQRMLVPGHALFAQLATLDVAGVVLNPGGDGRVRTFNKKALEQIAGGECLTCAALSSAGVTSVENEVCPPEVSLLEAIAAPAGTPFEHRRCTECGALYGYRSHYEFLMGMGGSYDEYFLWKLGPGEDRSS